MTSSTTRPSGLEAHGIAATRPVHWNLTPAVLYEHALRREEGIIGADGPLVCRTGQHTGRSPNDKFTVKDATSDQHVHWGKVNRPMTTEHFAALRADVVAHLGQRELFVQDLHAGADPTYRLPVRMISEYAWHSLFVRNLFIVPTDDERRSHSPEFTVMCAPTFQATPARHGSRSEVVIALNMAAREVIIAGTSYAGENKKSIFSVLNYVLPLKGVLSMHCSANIGAERRHGAVLRAVGHRQDDAVERSRPRPDRRRRARLERPRRLQLRGRLLRQDDPAVGRGRAADLRHDPPLRHRARERRRRRRQPGPRPRFVALHREHPGGLSDRVHRQRRAGRPGRPPRQHRHADRRRIRGAAADRPALGRGRDVPLPLRVHRQGRRHRKGRHRAERHLQHLLRGAVPAAQSQCLRAGCSASASPAIRRGCGW